MGRHAQGAMPYFAHPDFGASANPWANQPVLNRWCQVPKEPFLRLVSNIPTELICPDIELDRSLHTLTLKTRPHLRGSGNAIIQEAIDLVDRVVDAAWNEWKQGLTAEDLLVLAPTLPDLDGYVRLHLWDCLFDNPAMGEVGKAFARILVKKMKEFDLANKWSAALNEYNALAERAK